MRVMLMVVGAMQASIVLAADFEKIGDVKHVLVYQEDGKFMGWPANNGAWTADGVNLLVGFTHGDYKLSKSHNIGGRQVSWLARSTDMGETWVGYDPENYVGDFNGPGRSIKDIKKLKEPIDFSKPRFALRMVGTAYHGASDAEGHFFFSYDAGKTWKGPFRFGDTDIREWPELKNSTLANKKGIELTPRTDYVVEGERRCLLFMSARPKGKFATDRLFCIRTEDGGKSFQFVGWVVPPYNKEKMNKSVTVKVREKNNPHPSECRAVMSQTVKLNSGKLICAMRRRFAKYNWVDAYVSEDSGKTWTFLSEVGDAGAGNGNPPALGLTNKGRLVAAFGNRDNPGYIMTVYSDDEGKTWSKAKILRDGFGSEDMQTNDLGYPRLLRRKDGKMVCLYYWSTKDCLHHIAASIWDADR